jgi:hypothetical protein
MRKASLLFSILLVLSSISISHAQVVIGFGPKPLPTADENHANMNLLLKESYRLPILFTGDTIPDTVLLNEVYLMNYEYKFYCVRYKSDTSKIAIEIQKFDKEKGYTLTCYTDNRVMKRVTSYDKKYVLSGKYFEYYNSGYIKVDGNYTNGKKNGLWKYYDTNGNKTYAVKYKDGLMLKSKTSTISPTDK